jgi:hypothetical protein
MQSLPARYHYAYFFCLPLVQRMNALHTSYAIDQYYYYWLRNGSNSV